MILKALDEELTTSATETVDYSHLTIEHVMPRKWRDHWPKPVAPERSPEESVAHRDNVIHTLGNLTLLTGRLNGSVSNGPWSQKRPELDKSILRLNKDLQDHAPEQWDEDAILARGQRLYETALKVWPGPDAI